MQNLFTSKNILIVIIVILAGFLLWSFGSQDTTPTQEESERTSMEEQATQDDSTDTSPVAPSSPSQITSPPAPSTPGNSGRIVVGIKDVAALVNNLDSIFMSINGIELYHPSRGWVALSSETATYDLLELKTDHRFEYVIDKNILAGIYSGLRIPLGTVAIVENKIGHTATNLTDTFQVIPFTLKIEKDKTSVLLLDVSADDSLYVTEDDEYVFAPSIQVNTLSNVETIQVVGSKMEVFGKSTPTFSATVGTDSSGATQAGFSISKSAILDLVKGFLVVMPFDIDRSDIVTSAEDAINIAEESPYIDAIHSISLAEDREDDRRFWRITGFLGGAQREVEIDAMTGELSVK